MIRVQLVNVPAQDIKIVLNNQDVELSFFWRNEYLYANITSDGTPLRTGQICLNKVPLLLPGATAFSGNLAFADSRGTDNPDWKGLGDRWNLYYLDESESEVFDRAITIGK